VRREDEARARKLLERLLIGEKPVPKKARLTKEVAPPAIRLLSPRVAGLACLVAFSGAAVWALGPHLHGVPTRREHVAHHTKTSGSLALYEVDDSTGEAVRFAAASLPGGLRFEYEPVGDQDHGKSPSYVRAWVNEGETIGDARSRLAHWIDGVGSGALPSGDRFAIGSYEREDSGGGDPERGVRTYVLSGAPILTEENVRDAYVHIDRTPARTNVAVMVSFDEAGAERFADWTETHVKRRLAIVSNGDVASAPVVQSRIGGGSVQITMGAGTEATQLSKAKALVEALGGDADAAPE